MATRISSVLLRCNRSQVWLIASQNHACLKASCKLSSFRHGAIALVYYFSYRDSRRLLFSSNCDSRIFIWGFLIVSVARHVGEGSNAFFRQRRLYELFRVNDGHGEVAVVYNIFQRIANFKRYFCAKHVAPGRDTLSV